MLIRLSDISSDFIDDAMSSNILDVVKSDGCEGVGIGMRGRRSAFFFPSSCIRTAVLTTISVKNSYVRWTPSLCAWEGAQSRKMRLLVGLSMQLCLAATLHLSLAARGPWHSTVVAKKVRRGQTKGARKPKGRHLPHPQSQEKGLLKRGLERL